MQKQTITMMGLGGVLIAAVLIAGPAGRAAPPPAFEPMHHWQYAELKITRYPDGDVQAMLQTPDGIKNEVSNTQKDTIDGCEKLFDELGGTGPLKTMVPFLNLLGAQGWELLSIDTDADDARPHAHHSDVSGVFMFKREVR